jgi:ribonuclease HI
VPAHQVDGDPLNDFADQAASAVAVSQQSAAGVLPREQAERLAVPAVTSVAGRAVGKGGAGGAGRTAASGGGAGAGGAKTAAARGSAGSGSRSVQIAAKFPGTCACGKRYAAGEQIAKGTNGWGHPECAAATPG